MSEIQPTTYPFLRCAKLLNLPYGLVLAYRSAALQTVMARGTWWIDGTAEDLFGAFDCWEIAAAERLNGTYAAEVIIDACKSEDERRERNRMGLSR